MPWTETAPMKERMRFVTDWERDLYSMVELCERYGVSRKTGYKWPRGRRRAASCSITSRSSTTGGGGIRRSAISARGRSSGGANRKRWQLNPGVHETGASPSTAGRLLARRGLVKKRRRRRHYAHPGVVPPTTERPNDLWTADFKGPFRTRDGLYCYPLTVADQHTRYLLGCHGLLSTKGQGVRPVFDRLFREYGLPRAIRTDNGVPFATTGIHGLSQLNVWWIRLGIQHQRILPASPPQNGRHERMHRTLKAATARPPQAHLPAQQRAFNRFRVLYNDERPHQFLGGRTPASLYQPSPRPYTGAVPPIEYPGHYIPKRVTNAGTIRFKKRLLFIANSLKQQVVGLDEVDDGIWSIYFCNVLLARVDERDYVIRA